MDKKEISVLVCDDSALMRNLIGKIITNAEGLTLAGTAMNGRFALQKIPKLNPDIVLLDLEMPELDGIGFLKERQRLGYTMPVIILSSIARKGAQVTMDALSLGASDFIMKPTDGVSVNIREISATIVDTLKAYGRQGVKSRTDDSVHARIEPAVPPPRISTPKISVRPEKPETAAVEAPWKPVPIQIVAIGISTGGPNALRKVFSQIRGDLHVPVVVVQHMPEGFTFEFARSLDKICRMEVKEAQNGDILTPNRILIAPGNSHILVRKKKLAAVAELSDAPPCNGHRPSADVLFKSVAEEFGANALGVIMTGMGKDGAAELGNIYRTGGYTLGQDQESCIVYGMPRVAFENGFIREVVPLEEMAQRISDLVIENRG